MRKRSLLDFSIIVFLVILLASCSLFGGIEEMHEMLLASTFIPAEGNGLMAKLAWLEINAQSNYKYDVVVDAEEIITPYIFSYAGRDKVTVRLKGAAGAVPVYLSTMGAMFTVESGVTLILDNNITLNGREDNEKSLVIVNSGANLVMNAGAKITGNKGAYEGGGVYVNGGSFTMDGGEISGNNAKYGGGVFVNDGTFILNGGDIKINDASSGSPSYGDGGGVYIHSGSFIMNGGKISANDVYSYRGSGSGGGVYVEEGSFNMRGGTISGNNGTGYGGGVNIGFQGFFEKTGGTIYGDLGSDPNSHSLSSYYGYGGGNAVCAARFGDVGITIRDPTAGPSIYLYYNGHTDPPVRSGMWDVKVPGNDLVEKFDWIKKNAETGGSYSVLFNEDGDSEDYYFGDQVLSYAGKKDITITLSSASRDYFTIKCSDKTMFTIGSGVTLVLSDGGKPFAGNRTTSLLLHYGDIIVNPGGTLIMSYADIRNGRVNVDGGAFIMGGGNIYGNYSYNVYGGGVYINNGFFRKTDGVIYGYDQEDYDLRNYSGKGGHAVYAVRGSTVKYKNTTTYSWSIEEQILWFDGTTSPATFGGNWDN